MKITLIIILVIIIGMVVYNYAPIMKTPGIDYYKLRGKTLEVDGPNPHDKKITPKEYFKRTGLDGRNLN